MRVLQLHNATATRGGGEVAFEAISRLLRSRGVETRSIVKQNETLTHSIVHKTSAFFSGIYSVSAAREVNQAIRDFSPDLLHVHGLYPLLSPSVLRSGARSGLPVVLHCHSWHLVCPTGIRSSHGRYCDRCAGGHEYFCTLRNCRSSIVESVSYSIRHSVVRQLKLIHRHVTRLIACTNFAKRCYVDAGFDEDRIDVLPNMVGIPSEAVDPAAGSYVLYAGRMSREKGIDTLIAAASQVADIPFRMAGSGPLLEDFQKTAPDNVVFVGHIEREQLASLYRNARFVVVPSNCAENGPLVALEAMSHGVPVIASRVPGPTEIIDDGVNGLLFDPGNIGQLVSQVRLLWSNPDLCRRLGDAGRSRIVREYSEEVYFSRLSNIYRLAAQSAQYARA